MLFGTNGVSMELTDSVGKGFCMDLIFNMP